MIQSLTFTKKEKELIKILIENNFRYDYSMKFDSLRKEFEDEINNFKEHGILYHSNKGDYDSYIEFSIKNSYKSILKESLTTT